MVYVRNTLPQYEISPYCTDQTQLHCGTELVIALVYSPSKHKNISCQYSHFLNHPGSQWIIGGNLNVKHPYWGSRTTTTKGGELC